MRFVLSTPLGCCKVYGDNGCETAWYNAIQIQGVVLHIYINLIFIPPSKWFYVVNTYSIKKESVLFKSKQKGKNFLNSFLSCFFLTFSPLGVLKLVI